MTMPVFSNGINIKYVGKDHNSGSLHSILILQTLPELVAALHLKHDLSTFLASSSIFNCCMNGHTFLLLYFPMYSLASNMSQLQVL